jgi:ankyrin repeat protein
MALCRDACALELAQCDIMQGVMENNEKDREARFKDALSHIETSSDNHLEKKKLLQSLFNWLMTLNYNEYYMAAEYMLRLKLADVNESDGYNYPLHGVKDADWIPYLYAKDVKFNVIDCSECKKTPLMCAAEKGAYDVLMKLLAHNADSNVFNKMGESALSLAIVNGHRNCAEILLKSSDVESCVNKNVICYYDENRDEHISNVPSFIISIIRNDFLSFRLLWASKLVSADYKDVNNKTMLHYIAEYGVSYHFLRSWVDNTNAMIDVKDKSGNTPLNYFVQEVIFQVENNNKQVEEYLPQLSYFLSKDADPSVMNKNGISPLQSFKLAMNKKIAELNRKKSNVAPDSLVIAIDEIRDAKNFISSLKLNHSHTTFPSRPVKSSRNRVVGSEKVLRMGGSQ